MLRQFKDAKHGKPPLENCEEIKDWPSSFKGDVKQTTEKDIIDQLATIFDDFYQEKLSLNQYLGASKATNPTNSNEEYNNIFVNHLFTEQINPYQDTY